jgi:hypothetical protein
MMTGHCDTHVASPAVARCGTCHETLCFSCCADVTTPSSRLCWFCALELDASQTPRRFWRLRRQNPKLKKAAVPHRSWNT